jgi:malonyl-CoA O-methyltransferase
MTLFVNLSGRIQALSDNRTRIGKGFHRQAAEYDQHAVVQKRVVANLDRLTGNHCSASPNRLLDVGCGTGALTAAMARRYPAAGIFGLDLAFNMALKAADRVGKDGFFVNGDAEQLPFQDGTFDLVVSASTFQWARSLENCFGECCRVLKPGGVFCAAFFGGKTLWELQESYREALSKRYSSDDIRSSRLQRFKNREDTRLAMEGHNFDQIIIATEEEIELHPDVPALLRAIKGVGASTTARSDAGSGLGWRGVISDMTINYKSRFSRGGLIPATYEVIYVVARRGEDNN